MYRSAPARCMAGCCLECCKRIRRQIGEARLRSDVVVVPPPGLDDHLRLGARAEPFEAQAFVAELAVEALAGGYEPLLTEKQLSGWLGISLPTLQRLRSSGKRRRLVPLPPSGSRWKRTCVAIQR